MTEVDMLSTAAYFYTKVIGIAEMPASTHRDEAIIAASAEIKNWRKLIGENKYSAFLNWISQHISDRPWAVNSQSI